MRNVLEHPMFKSEANKPHEYPKPGRSKPQEHTMASGGDANSHKPITARFKKVMSNGNDTQLVVKDILCSLLAKSKSAMDQGSYIRDSGIADILRSWLFQNGMDRDTKVLGHRTLAFATVKVLVAGGYRDLVERWLQLEQRTMWEAKNEPGWPVARLLYDYVVAETKVGKGLEPTLWMFLNNLDALRSLQTIGDDERKKIRTAFRLAGSYLMTHLHQGVKRGQIDIVLYDRLSQSAIHWTKKLSLERAWFAIHHPNAQDPNPTYEYLQHMAHLKDMKLAPHRKVATAHLALDAAEIFVSKGEDRKAFWLMTTLQDRFADVMSMDISQDRQGKKSKAEKDHDAAVAIETESLRQLETLALG